uniref:SSD domain-containing protein n=1 Tax=Setaria digitata TaxID=48799 RepID=A0A915PRL7_9BILA
MRITSVESRLRQFFQWYGEFGYQWRWFLVISPLIVTPLLSLGFCRFTALSVDDPFYVFTPVYARWHREFNTFASLWPLNENKFLPGKSFEMKRFINVLVKAKDGGNLLRNEVLDEIQALNQWIMFNISIPTSDSKYNLTYQDLCLSYDWVCGANEHISMLQERLKVGNFVELTYPRAGSKDTPIYLGTVLSGVKLDESNNTIKTVKLTQLFYFLKQESNIVRRYSTAFSYAVEYHLLHVYKSDIISFSFSHYHSLQDGLAENAKDFTWNFFTSFFILSIYATVFSYVFKKQPRTGIDWVRSKPYVACAGLITTLLAMCSGFGLALMIGIPYNVINTIIPFLIIAIGVDDMFVMNACWDQTSQSDAVSKRMRDMMAHAGVTISITNITDIISFAIGCISELPGIQLFCSYACITFIFCYLYQLTFFMAFLAIMGVVEKNQRHCLLFYKVHKPSAKEENTKDSARFCSERNDYEDILRCSSTDSGSDISCRSGISVQSRNSTLKIAVKAIDLIIAADKQKSTEVVDIDNNFITEGLCIKEMPQVKIHPVEIENTRTQYFFGHIYAEFILRKECAILTYIFYLLYIVIAVVGCLNYSEGLEPENLVTNDHYTAHYFADLKNFWACGTQLHVAVLHPPNFTDPIQREEMMAVVRAFENTEYTLGREGTIFFFLEYLNYLDEVNAELENTDRIWNTKLLSWLKYTGGSNQWTTDIRFSENGTFQAFQFQACFKIFKFSLRKMTGVTIAVQNTLEASQHKIAAQKLRKIADRQPFKIEIFHETFPFADQYIIIVPATVRSIVISLICMAFVAVMLVPSLASCALIILSIISITTGVFGYMTFWGVNLDAVSMISIIMSIGFAVDLSSHVTYAFVTATGSSKERVIYALESLGWPIFQGAASTIAGVSMLYTVNAYIILTFFKTIWLTVVIGLLHGLLFIPVTLNFFPFLILPIHP